MKERIQSHRDLIVFPKSFASGKRIFELTKSFPREEMFSLTDQVRRSSRSVSANIAEAWRKRRFEKHFCSTLNVAEAEAAETQVWIEYAAAHGCLDAASTLQAIEYYDEILRMIVAMIQNSSKWCIPPRDIGSRRVDELRAEYVVQSETPLLDQENLLTHHSPSPTLPHHHSPYPTSPSPSHPEAEYA